MKARSSAIFVSLVALAFGCSGGDAGPRSAPAAVAPAPASGTPAPAPAPPAGAAPTREPASPRKAREPAQLLDAPTRSRLLREGRAAHRPGDHASAVAAFEQLVRASPRAPRMACEAGLVAHAAGHLERASAWIDLGLRAFGPDERLPEDLRVPAAMCLYNAGLVREARGDLEGALDAYERSLRLRRNATVQRRRDAVRARIGREDDEDDEDDDEASTYEGVRVQWRTRAG